MKFYTGVEGEITTGQNTLGWPAEAENDKYTEPLSRVSFMTNNPYTVEVQPVMSTQSESDRPDPNAAGVAAEDMDFDVADDGSVSTKVGTVGWPAGAENEEGTGPDGRKLDEHGNAEGDEPTPEPEPEPTPPPTQPAPEA